jgi:prevent-host-death family protein
MKHVHIRSMHLEAIPMEISFLDLRKRPGRILEALERRESVTITRRGKAIARLVPMNEPKRGSAADHPAFGMWKDHPGLADVEQSVRKMRKGW